MVQSRLLQVDKVVNKFVATCLQVCYNLRVFTCIVGDITILPQLDDKVATSMLPTNLVDMLLNF